MNDINEFDYESLLAHVEKPGRYLGNEKGSIRKDLAEITVRFALAFPEVYEIAQSHPGLQILYDLLNRRADVYAERVYTPWFDMEALLRERGLPLVSLETYTPLAHFDVVGFSLQYELTYTNLLTMLDLGGIPLDSADRDETHPLVIAGGPCAFNPEPLAPFLDAVLLGDGEEAIHDICAVAAVRRDHGRDELLRQLAAIDGVYVPSFYAETRGPRGRLVSVDPVAVDQPANVRKRILKDLDSVPVAQTHIVPNLRVVHGRPSLEVMRGCVKGCRFCQAGYIYRPLRERSPHKVLESAQAAVAATGTQELSLLSLSTGDYSCVNPVITELMNQYSADRIAVSLPSTRVDALAPSLLEQIKRVRKTGFTLAPEAGTQRLRDIIQKEYGEDELIEAARQIFGLGWKKLKLYFMIGLPGETEEDLLGIAKLSARVAAAGGRGVEVTASVSTFVPKPHTPFQWSSQIDVAETQKRQRYVREELKKRRIRFKWHDARTSHLEGVISRGGRGVAAAIRRAYELGCRFDGWTEHCRYDLWEQAMRETEVDGADQLRRRFLDEVLPWDHIDSGVTKKFLQRDLADAVEGRLTPDCSIERCTYCGACDFKEIRNVTYHLDGAKGSEHRGETVDHWATGIVGEEDTPGGWEPRGWHKLHTEGFANAMSTASDNGEDAAEVTARAQKSGSRDNGKGLGNAEEWLSASSEALSAAPPLAEPPTMRVRIDYAKVGRARFISHLELIEVFSSALRRAHIPVAFSGGFRPMPRLRFSPGLPVGAESDCEVLDIDLSERRAAAAIGEAFSRELPEGLSVRGAREISLRSPSPDSEMSGFCYRVNVGQLSDSGLIDEAMAAFVNSPSYSVRRHTKKGEREVDARALVPRMERVGPEHIELDIRFSEKGSIKPSDVLASLFSLDTKLARSLPMRKTRVFLREDGELTTGGAAA